MTLMGNIYSDIDPLGVISNVFSQSSYKFSQISSTVVIFQRLFFQLSPPSWLFNSPVKLKTNPDVWCVLSADTLLGAHSELVSCCCVHLEKSLQVACMLSFPLLSFRCWSSGETNLCTASLNWSMRILNWPINLQGASLRGGEWASFYFTLGCWCIYNSLVFLDRQ